MKFSVSCLPVLAGLIGVSQAYIAQFAAYDGQNVSGNFKTFKVDDTKCLNLVGFNDRTRSFYLVNDSTKQVSCYLTVDSDCKGYVNTDAYKAAAKSYSQVNSLPAKLDRQVSSIICVNL